MTFPTTSILDDFNRANTGPPPSANWTTPAGALDGLKVSSNRLVANQDGNGCRAYWNVTTFGPDCEFYIDIANSFAAGEVFQIYARLDDTNLTHLINGFNLIVIIDTSVNGGGFQLIRYDSSTPPYYVDHGILNFDVGNGDSVGIQCIGSAIKTFHKPSAGSWTQKHSVTDANNNVAGTVLIDIDFGSIALDNFGGGTLDDCSTFPVRGILDDFNRGDGGLGANWHTPTGYGAVNISSNQAINSDVDSEAFWVTSVGPDCEAYMTLTGVNGVGCDACWSFAIYLRSQDTDLVVYEFYKFQLGGTIGGTCTWYIAHNNSMLTFGTFTPSVGDSFGISAVGNVLTAYHKTGGTWSTLGTVTDSSITGAGYIGFALSPDIVHTTSMTADDFGGGPVYCAPPSGFTGNLSKTLGGLSLSATGYLERFGALDQTLPTLTIQADGYLERLGALNKTFPTLSVQSTGTLSAYHVPTLINVRDITASGAGAIGVDVVNNAISQNVRANSLQVENGGILEAHSVYYDTITTIGTGTIVPLRSDRAAWDVTDYPDRHASDIYGSTWAYHRNPALSGSYTVNNPSVRRILDVASVSLNEMAALLGTLLDDLGLT